MPAHRGFSLVELLAVLAVSAILLSIAVPSFSGLVRSTQVSSASSDLLASLLLARSEAMKRRHRVSLCKSADGLSCTAGGGWEQGWIVFADPDGDGQRDAGELILQVQWPAPDGLRLTGTGSVARYVSYAANGGTKLAGGGFQAGTLTVCSTSAKAGKARQIVVNATGRPRTQTAQLPACG